MNIRHSSLRIAIVATIAPLLAFSCWLGQGRAQSGRTLLTREECLQDLAQVFEIIESVHPDPYSVVPYEEMVRGRRKLEESLPNRVSTTQFFRQLAPLIARMQDGHTSVPIPTAALLGEESRKLLPLKIEFRSGQAWVTADYSSESPDLVGKIVQRINGRPVSFLVAEMMSHQHQELPASRMRRVAEYFRAYLWLVCEVESPYLLELVSQDKRLSEPVKLEGKTLSAIASAERAATPGGVAPYSYRFDKESRAGILEYNACINDEQFREFLRATFTKIARENPAALIVDARKNGGGSAYANVALFDYLTSKPYRMYSSVEMKVSRILKEKLGRKLFEGRYFAWDTPDGTTQSFQFPLRKPGDNPLRFAGPLIVLSGASTLSSGMNFVNAVKDYELGTIIGAETGNPATAFGDIEAFRLSHTGLELYVSTKYFIRPSGSKERRGVLPDYEIEQSSQDTLAGRDTVLQFAKQLAIEENAIP